MKNILIVVDMQNDFIDGALGTKEAIEIIPKVIDKIKYFEGEVIFTRDTHDEGYLESQEGTKLPVVHCVKETEGWNLENQIQRLAEKLESKIFDKVTFASVEMADYLKSLWEKESIGKIELIGVCTDICVISNAILLKAVLPEVKIIVDSSCCAGVTPESHNNALKSMNMCQIEII